MAEQLLNRLITAVENLRSAGNNQINERNRDESVEDQINRLFPSVGLTRESQNIQSTSTSTRSGNANEHAVADPDREYVAQTRTFNSSNNYRPKGKRKQSSTRGQKRKRDESV